MIVCLCRVVTDRAIDEAIDGGARTIDEVGRACGAGTGCGSCKTVVAEMLDEAACSGRCDDCPSLLPPLLAPAGKAA